MEKVYKQSKRLLQAYSLLAIALGSPLKAMDFDSLQDRAARVVGRQLAIDTTEGRVDINKYLDIAKNTGNTKTMSIIVHPLPEDTRREFLGLIRGLPDKELTVSHKILAASIFRALQMDSTDCVPFQLSFKENKIMGSHPSLGSELDLTRFFGDPKFDYFSDHMVKVNVDWDFDPGIIPILSQSGISKLNILLGLEFEEGESGEKLSTFFQSGWDKLIDLSVFNGLMLCVNSLFKQIKLELAVIMNSQSLRNLKYLTIKQYEIGPREARAIAESSYLKNLERLDFFCNEIGETEKTTIRNNPIFANTQISFRDPYEDQWL